MTAGIDGNYAVSPGEVFHLRSPHATVDGEAMKEDDGCLRLQVVRRWSGFIVIEADIM